MCVWWRGNDKTKLHKVAQYKTRDASITSSSKTLPSLRADAAADVALVIADNASEEACLATDCADHAAAIASFASPSAAATPWPIDAAAR